LLQKFQTESQVILDIWLQIMSEAHEEPDYKLDTKYVDRFFAQVLELNMNQIPAWALRRSGKRCLVKNGDAVSLRLSDWKIEARKELLNKPASDIEIESDGTTRVIEGSPTDFGRKLIGPIQNYSEDA